MDSIKLSLNAGWRFHREPTDALAYEEAWYKGFDDAGADWQDVTLPHDWSVSLPFSQDYSSGTGYLAGGYGWYRLHFKLPEAYRGKRLTLCFDGVYKNSQVWCNTYHLGKRPYGYVPFQYDVTHCAYFGDEENVVAVKVSHPDLADSRWFTGSGISRDVWLMVEEPVHPAVNGVFFSTLPKTDCACAQVRVAHTLVNDGAAAAEVAVTTTLMDQAGDAVLTLNGALTLAPGATQNVVLEGGVPHPHRWSVDDPYLYTLQVSLAVNGDEAYQVTAEKVGIRTVRFDADHGFFLNDEPMKLRGICMHHDGGCLGAAMTRETWARRLIRLKAMGCNALRTSHNPHPAVFYAICDELGLMVMDEAFDEWENPKNKWSTGHNVYPPKHQGYAEDFPTWHERDLEAFILRDRNHPSVIMWSIGNELDYPNDPYVHPLFQEMTGNNDANKPSAERIYNPNKPNMERLIPIARELAAIVRRHDATRPVTLAASFPELSAQLGIFEDLDLICYNYKEHLYAQDHARFPDKAIIGSENWHDLYAWRSVTENDYVCGLFVWTGADYLGEALGWPYRAYLTGYLNMAGFPKYYYDWGRSFWTKTPFASLYTCAYTGENGETVYTTPVWQYAPGEKVLVRCYTNLPRAELFLNGESLGVCVGRNDVGTMDWLVDYAPGELTVKAFSLPEDGPAIAGDTALPAARGEAAAALKTPDATTALKLTRWASPLCEPETGFIEQIEIELTDAAGALATHEAQPVAVCVSGDGVLIGLENGDQTDLTAYTEATRKTTCGQLAAFVRRTGMGPITVHACCEGGIEAELTF